MERKPPSQRLCQRLDALLQHGLQGEQDIATLVLRLGTERLRIGQASAALSDAFACLSQAEVPEQRRLVRPFLHHIEIDPDQSLARIYLKSWLPESILEDTFVQPPQAGEDGSRTHQGRLCSTPQRF